MNQTQYAAHRGVSIPYINRLYHQGKIPREPDGSIDPVKADAALLAAADPAKRGVVAANAKRHGKEPPADLPPDLLEHVETGGFHSAKTKDAHFAAKLRELEYKRQIGEVVERAAYAKGCEDAGAALGNELDGMVHRLAPLVAGEPSITKCRELIAAEVFRACEAIADTLQALAADPRDGTRQ